MAFHRCNCPMTLGFLLTQPTPTLRPSLDWCMTCYRSCTNTLQLLQNSHKISSRCMLELHQDLFAIRNITFFVLIIKSYRSYWHSSGSLWTEEASRGCILQQRERSFPDWFSTCTVWSEESLIPSLSELCGTCITCTLHLRNSIWATLTHECGTFHAGLDHFKYMTLYTQMCVANFIYIIYIVRSAMVFSWHSVLVHTHIFVYSSSLHNYSKVLSKCHV